jgi:hypothetical protein
MALRAGKIVHGATGTYELLDALKAPPVYPISWHRILGSHPLFRAAH